MLPPGFVVDLVSILRLIDAGVSRAVAIGRVFINS
jgi:hypothetical protein